MGNICISCRWPSSMLCNFISLLLIKSHLAASTMLLPGENTSPLRVLNESRAGVPSILPKEEQAGAPGASTLQYASIHSNKRGWAVSTALTLPGQCCRVSESTGALWRLCFAAWGHRGIFTAPWALLLLCAGSCTGTAALHSSTLRLKGKWVLGRHPQFSPPRCINYVWIKLSRHLF